jgi:hypothetical protein
MHNDGSADWVGGYNGALMYCIGTNLQFWYNGYVTSLSDCRFFAGLSNTVGQTWPASDSPSGKFAMFRFSSIASDTNFQCITSDGSTLTVVDSGVAPVANTGNVFAIEFVDSTPAVNFYIDGALVATITTHLPGNGVLVAYQAGVSSHVANTSLCGFSLVQVWSDR